MGGVILQSLTATCLYLNLLFISFITELNKHQGCFNIMLVIVHILPVLRNVFGIMSGCFLYLFLLRTVG